MLLVCAALINLSAPLLISGARAATQTPAPTSAATSRVTTSSTPAAPPTKGPSPTPTPAIIVSVDGEVLFPMLVRFSVIMHLGVTQVKSAQIRIAQGAVIDQTLDVPLGEANLKPLNDEASTLYYVWPLTETNAPTPFTTLTFGWTVIDVNGLKYTQAGSVAYADNSRQWKNTDVDPLRIYTSNSGLNLDYVQNNVMRAYTLIAGDTGIKHNWRFILYDAGTGPCQADTTGRGVIVAKDKTAFECDPAQAVKVYGARGFTLIQLTTPLLEGMQDQLIQTIATDAYDTIWKSAAAQPPAWFRSGIGQLYGLVGHAYALLLARDAARNDQLLTLDALAVPPVPNTRDNGASLRAWNSQSYMLTLYLAARFGAATPVQIAKQIAQNSKFEDALSALASAGTGNVTVESLYTDWQNWLFSPDADSAIGWNPYIAEATVTPTPSDTPFPSLTPTVTGTPPTDTPEPSDTPFPSAVPTVVPPSPTPLPPGSLKTATPSQ